MSHTVLASCEVLDSSCNTAPQYGEPPRDFDDLVHLYGNFLIELGASDSLKMATRLYQRGLLKSPPRGKDYLAFLSSRVQRLLAEDKVSKFEYPTELPRDENEMFRKYRRMVMFAIRKVIQWGIEFEDAEQEVWAKLTHSNVLAKYLQVGIFYRIPPTLTAEESQAYLGISEDDWYSWCSRPGSPAPVRGHWESPTAEYRLSDIQDLDTSGYFRDRPYPRHLPASATEARKFEVYLRTAAQNHARNVIRPHSRRFIKDAPMSNPNVYLTGSGSNYHVSYSESQDSWEASIASQGPGQDSLCDAKALVDNIQECMGDYQTPLEVLAKMVKVARKTGLEVDSDEALSFVLALSEGHTSSGASGILQRMKTKLHACQA